MLWLKVLVCCFEYAALPCAFRVQGVAFMEIVVLFFQFQVDFGHLGGYLSMICQSFRFLTSHLTVCGTQGVGTRDAMEAVGEEVKREPQMEVSILCCVSSYPANTEFLKLQYHIRDCHIYSL